jgi:IS5 family transposase
VHAASASPPHEVTPIKETLHAGFVEESSQRLIGNRVYDYDSLDCELREEGVEMIASHRRNRKKQKAQDGRRLRRYKKRWKVERLFAWLHNFRWLVVRYEWQAQNYLGFVHLGCIVIFEAFVRWLVAT